MTAMAEAERRPAPARHGQRHLGALLVRPALRALLVLLGLALAWILASSELARDREPNCLHARYRDPVTGREVMRACPFRQAGERA